MKKRAYKRSKRAWLRVGVWVGAAGLLVLSIGWLFPAIAATPTWWDCTYGYRKQLTVSAVSAVPVDYTVSLTFDHAGLVSTGKSQADGDDIRLLYWNGSAWAEIDRFLDPGSAWNTTTTKVWFKVQAAIGSSSSDGNYYLYYSNTSATSPPANPTNIFFFYDGYESGTFSAWGGVSAGTGDTNTIVTSPVHTGTYAAESFVDPSGSSYARVENNFTGQSGFHSTVWVYIPTAYPAEDDITVIEYYTGGWGAKVASLAIRAPLSDMRPLLGVWTESPVGWYFGSPALTTGAWHRLEMKVIVDPVNGRVEVWQDGVKSIDLSNVNTGTGTIDHSLENIFWKSGTTNSHTLDFDDSFDRVWVDPEPTTALGAELANDCAPPPSLCGWQARRKLTFDNSAQAENLMNFPVLVKLDSSRIDYGKTQDAGQDLRFYDSDGTTLLAHEIETWDELGTSYVWVKVPQIDASSNTDYIWMYYGNATAPDGQNPTAVWSNGYVGVWHLKESPSGASPQMKDSTSNASHGTSRGSMTSADQVAGQIGGSLDFDGTDDYVEVPHIASYLLDNGTVSLWFKTNDLTTQHGLWSKDSTGYDTGGHYTLITELNSTTRFRLQSTTASYELFTPVVSTGTWYLVTSTFGSGVMKYYLNDAAPATDPYTGGMGTTSGGTGNFEPITIGASQILSDDLSATPAQDFANGQIDEVRISSAARSANWIKAQYKSMTDAFITYDPEEANGTSVSYFTPDAAAAGINVPVTMVGNICDVPTVTTSNSDIIVGPVIVTDATGAVVTQNGKALSTVFFFKPDARPTTGITVSIDGKPLSQTFDIVIPAPDPNVTSGTVSLSGRSARGTAVLGGLTVASGGTLKISTSGNQGYLPATILVKGDVNIAGTLNVSGTDGTNAAANCVGGDGGVGAPGGGGGGGGGITETGCSGGGPVTTDLGPLHDTYVKNADETANGAETVVKVKKRSTSKGSYRQSLIKFDTSSITGTITSANLKLNVTAISAWPDPDTLEIYEFTDNSWTESTVWSTRPPDTAFGAVLGTLPTPANPDPTLLTIDVTAYVLAQRGGGNNVISFTARMAANTNGGAFIDSREGTVPPVLTIVSDAGAGGGTAAVGGSGYSGGGGGASKGGTGTGGAGGAGTGAAGSAASGATGGDGGTALSGATGGGGAVPDSGTIAGGGGGGGGTGDPFGSGGTGAADSGGPAGQGGGGGGAPGNSPGGGGGGGFATAGGSMNATEGDAGFGGNVTGNAQLVPLAGGSGGGGGGPDVGITTKHRGAGGGGGAGAVLVYSTGPVSITGTITANGGNGGNGYTSGADGSGGGGGGSGGAMLIQSSDVTASGTLTTTGGTGGTSTGNAAGGNGGDGRIRIDGLASGSVPGTAGSKFIGPVLDTLVGTTVSGRADGGSSITLYVYDETGAQVTGSPYTATASGSTGTVGTWSIPSVTFPSGVGYLAVKQTSGGTEVFGPGRSTRGIHLINWREVY